MTRFRLSFLLPLLAFVSLTLSSCEAIGTIFKAGTWTGIIGVVLLLVLTFFIVNRFRRP